MVLFLWGGIFPVFEIAELLEGRPIIYKSLATLPILTLYSTYFSQMAENCWKKNTSPGPNLPYTGHR